MTDQLKRGRIVIGGGAAASTTQTTRGMGCMCVGPVNGTPYCPCTLNWMLGQVDEDDYDDEEYEDRKK